MRFQSLVKRKITLKALLALFLFSLPLSSAFRVWPSWSVVRGRRIDYYSLAIYLSDLVLVVSLVMFKLWKDFVGLISRNVLKAIVLFIVFGLNLLFSSNPSLTFSFILQWIWLIVGWLFLVKARSQVGNKTIVIYLAFSLIPQVLLGLIQVTVNSSLGLWLDWVEAPPFLSRLLWLLGEIRFNFQTPGIAQTLVGGKFRVRAYGTLPHPNILAGFFLTSLVLLQVYKWIGNWRKLVWLLSLIFSFGLLATFTRTAWLAAGIVGGYLLTRNRKNLLSSSMILLIFLVSLVLFRERWQSLIREDCLAWQERIYLSRVAIKMFFRRPLVGTGLGTFIGFLPRVTSDMRMVYLLQPVHNFFLLLLAETGIIGVLSAFFFVCRAGSISAKTVPLYLTLFLLVLTDHYLATTHPGRFLLATVLALTIQVDNDQK
jgi:hypothetical protein